MKKHGTARALLEDWKRLARASGLSLEQVADVMDTLAEITKPVTGTTDDGPPLAAKGPKDVQ